MKQLSVICLGNSKLTGVLANAKFVQQFESTQLSVMSLCQKDQYPVVTMNYNNSVRSNCLTFLKSMYLLGEGLELLDFANNLGEISSKKI